MPDDLDKLRELAAQLPRGLRADWRYSNHYELTDQSPDYWWLDLQPSNMPEVVECDSEFGKRLGLVMDLATEVGRLRDAGVL